MLTFSDTDQFLQPSDEEVLDYSGIEDDHDDEDEEDEDEDEVDYGEVDDDDEIDDIGTDKRKREAEEEDEDLGGWGPSKKDYYNADAIETEQDALDEEAEARRLQKKQLQAMSEADFGFDEDEWLEQDDEKTTETENVVTEVLPQLRITDEMSEEERLKILRTRYPEFDYISKEYLRLQPLHDELAAAAHAAERLIHARTTKAEKANGERRPTPMAVTKYRACAAYLAAMAMYFAILGSTASEDGSPVIAMDPAELHEHPVMECLLKTQKTWTRLESLPVADPMVEASNGGDLSIIDEVSPAPEDGIRDAVASKQKEKKLKKSKSQRAAEAAQAKSEARRAEKLRQTEQELATLASLTDKATLRKATNKKADQPKVNLFNPDDSDFGEETELTAHELAEKARKKKSLRFYTSQIAQKANKRDAAGRDYGGDADVPHRERLKDRQARLQAAAEKRGQNADSGSGPGAPLGEGGESSGDEDAETRGFEDQDGYYDLIAAKSHAKKQAKLDRAAAYALAAKEGGMVVPEEIIGEDGRRQITYV